jgi:hypothetical protein
MAGIIFLVLYIVNNAFSAYRNLFNVFAEEMARHCRCIIQLDLMDSADLLFCMSAVRNKNEIQEENYYFVQYHFSCDSGDICCLDSQEQLGGRWLE